MVKIMNEADISFFNSIYDMTYDAVFRYVSSRCSSSEDAADIISEVYCELCRVITEKGSGYIKTPGAFVMRVAKTKLWKNRPFFDRFKRVIPMFSLNSNREEKMISELEKEEWFCEDEMVDTLLLEEIWREIEKEGEETVEIFTMRYINDLSIGEIASRTGLPLHTVRNRLYRTLENLRIRFGGSGK